MMCPWSLKLTSQSQQVLLFAVFVVRGKPYSARHVGSVLFPDGRHGGCTCAARAFKPVLAFLWTVVSHSLQCFIELQE